MEPSTTITTTSGYTIGDIMDLLVKIVAGIAAVVVAIHQGWARLEHEKERHNGGTPDDKTVKVLERIDSKMDAHKEVLGKIATGVEDLIRNEEIAVIVAERVAAKLRAADEERAREVRQRSGG